MATYYVDSVSGVDANSGLSEALAWKTLVNVNATEFPPGTTVKFKRGSHWHHADTGSGYLVPCSDGTAAAPITFTDYGSGALPLFDVSRLVADSAVAGSWTDYNATVANTWYMDRAANVSRLWIDDVEYPKAATAAAVSATARWWYGVIGGTIRLLVYSVANPSTQAIWEMGEAEGDTARALHSGDHHYLTFKNLKTLGGWYAAGAFSGASHITFDGCNLGDRSLGGIRSSSLGGGNCDYLTVRHCIVNPGYPAWATLGAYPAMPSTDGISLWAGDYASIHDNVISGWGHSDINLYSGGGLTVNHGKIYNNACTGDGYQYCRGFGTTGITDGDCSDNDIHDNVFRNHTVRTQLNGDHNKFRDNTIIGPVRPAGGSRWAFETGEGIHLQGYDGPCHHNEITGNTFTDCSGVGVRIHYDDPHAKYGNVISGNTFINCGSDPLDASYEGIAIWVDAGDDNIWGNIITDNRISSSAATAFYYRGVPMTAPVFNTKNDRGDTISGNFDSSTVPPVAENSLANLLTLVNGELENHAAFGSWQAVGDGTTTSFTVAPLARYVVDDDTWAVTLSGAATTAFTMDFDSGVIRFDDAPALAAALTASFNHVYWTDELVAQAVNAGINNLFPAFYVPKADTSISLVADTYEYAMPAETQFIIAVETRAAATGAYTKMHRNKYEWLGDGDHLTLRFFGAPTGFMRVRCINRPAPLVDPYDSIELDSGLPSRAKDPIVSYACWYLLTQKIAPRIRSDIAVNTQGVGTLSPRQIADGTQAWMMRYQLQLAANKMPPWLSR